MVLMCSPCFEHSFTSEMQSKEDRHQIHAPPLKFGFCCLFVCVCYLRRNRTACQPAKYLHSVKTSSTIAFNFSIKNLKDKEHLIQMRQKRTFFHHLLYLISFETYMTLCLVLQGQNRRYAEGCL